jgi:hypothetical protein
MVEATTTLNVPVANANTEWREEFKRFAAEENREFGSAGWGEIFLIGDRLVVKDVNSGAEQRLQSALEELVRRAHRSAMHMVKMRDSAREELKRALLTRERTARAMQDRFRSF